MRNLEKSLPKCKEHILSLHAFTSCDTTSAFCNRGKVKFAKSFEKMNYLHDSTNVCKNVNEDANNIFPAGVTCTLGLYRVPVKNNKLNTLRCEHLKRTYLQIQIYG